MPDPVGRDDVLLAFAEAWNEDREFLVTAGRRLNQARDAAVMLARELTAATLVEIGRQGQALQTSDTAGNDLAAR